MSNATLTVGRITIGTGKRRDRDATGLGRDGVMGRDGVTGRDGGTGRDETGSLPFPSVTSVPFRKLLSLQKASFPFSHFHSLQSLPFPSVSFFPFRKFLSLQKASVPFSHFHSLQSLPFPSVTSVPFSHFHSLQSPPFPSVSILGECFKKKPKNVCVNTMLPKNTNFSDKKNHKKRWVFR